MLQHQAYQGVSGDHAASRGRNSPLSGNKPSSRSTGKPAVFLDKDGTLIRDVPYNVDPAQIHFAPGAILGLRLLHGAGYPLIVITNQSGVALGYFTEAALVGVEQRLNALLAVIGVPLAGFYYCPHHPEGTVATHAIRCECRKPQPGLLLRAAQDHAIDLSQSWFIGDILHDVEAGRAAGCRTVLMDNGHETEWQLSRDRCPHHVVKDLTEAARVILAVDCQRGALSLPGSSEFTP